MDTTGLCLWPTMAESFRSKADVVKFALLTSAKVDNGVTEIDYSKAQEIIDFVCKNVELPDVTKDEFAGMSDLIGHMKNKIDTMAVNEMPMCEGV
jgi:hypothetical protein